MRAASLGTLWAGLCGLAAATSAPEPVGLHSRSGQFVVYGLPLGPRVFAPPSTSSVRVLRVDPAVLAVSLERIKAALLTTLDLTDEWKGSIAVGLYPARGQHEPIDITSTRYSDAWGYRMALPDELEPARMVTATVQVLLQEIANRQARQHAAELPPWLAPGLAAGLRATSLAGLTPELHTSTVAEGRRTDPLSGAREQLRARPPLSFNELSWPGAEHVLGPEAAHYEACAQLFVHDLLHLNQGRAGLRELVRRLPENLNWQTTFLQVFSAHFRRLADADKWWSLNAALLAGREPGASWSREESWRQLDELLAAPVEVRLDARQLPLRAPVRLQRIIAEWPLERQMPALFEKTNWLAALALRAPSDLAALAADYGRVLEGYLQRRTRPEAGLAKLQMPTHQRVVIRDTLRRLDELDARRDRLRQQTHAPPAPQLSRTHAGPAGPAGRAPPP
jgi:hypothetical protein